MDLQALTFLMSLAALVVSLLALAMAVRSARHRGGATTPTLPAGAMLNPGGSTVSTTMAAESTFEIPSEVVDLVREGNKIQAVKMLRDSHPGLGLAEAKRAVDALSRL